VEPLRPSDYDDGSNRAVAPVSPTLGTAGWARFLWRQLTSMKTALFLLLLLALGAIPGSLVPQRSADPNGVVQFERDNPELFATLDALQLFDTYTSVWFSAIYILLFISLVGCIIPRTAHHIRALRTPPPKTPKNLSRLEGYQTLRLEGAAGKQPSADEALAAAERVLKKSGYRIQRYGHSVAGEKGYCGKQRTLSFISPSSECWWGSERVSGLNTQAKKYLLRGHPLLTSWQATTRLRRDLSWIPLPSRRLGFD